MLFLLGPASYNAHHGSLPHSYHVKEGTVAGTRELAAAAFNAAYHVVLLGGFPILVSGKFAEQVWLQSHGARRDALGTPDAGANFASPRFLVGHEQ